GLKGSRCGRHKHALLNSNIHCGVNNWSCQLEYRGMGRKGNQIPAVVVRADDFAVDVMQNSDEGREVSGDKLERVTWTRDNIAILREVLPLLEKTTEGIVVRYNFTHLSNILKIDRKHIYGKMIELYRGDDENMPEAEVREVLVKSAMDPRADSEPVSVDSLINVAAASKLLHSRRLLGQPSGDESSVGESDESDESSVEESLLQREILESDI
ncbi:hypothetical protein PICMEDRAFT_179251, partial [Pichia membranifaciens NRRL Y-2026]